MEHKKMTVKGTLPNGDIVELGQLTMRKNIDIEKKFGKNGDETEILIEKVCYSFIKLNDSELKLVDVKKYIDELDLNNFTCLVSLWNSNNGINKEDFENFLKTVEKTV